MLYECKESFSINWKGKIINFYENEVVDSSVYDESMIKNILNNYNVVNASPESIKLNIKSKNEELNILEEVELANLQKKIIQLKSEISVLKSYL